MKIDKTYCTYSVNLFLISQPSLNDTFILTFYIINSVK